MRLRLVKFLKSNLWVVFLFFILSIVLFSDFLFKGLLPIPSDVIVGAFHPWLDNRWLGISTIFPVKNFEIRDIVYQLYPWRQLVTESLKNGVFPLWNPYNFTGISHIANIFAAPFYPFNFLFFLFPFSLGWSVYIFLQPLLICFSTYLFLRNLKLGKVSSFFGSAVFAFSSVIIARLEFGILGHAAVWLPLALLSEDKIFKDKKYKWWFAGVIFLLFNYLSGYLQVAIYSYAVFLAYGIFRFFQYKNKKALIFILITPFVALSLGGVQTLPFLSAVKESSRIVNYGKEHFFADEFFLPVERLITFLIPDFFGNPVTKNFWGKTSYYEFAGYLGIIPLFFALFSLFKRNKKKEIIFWLILTITGFVFILPNYLSSLPYRLNIPGFSVLVPSRIIFVIDFSFSILCAFGFEGFINSKEKFRKKFSFITLFLFSLCFLVISIFATGKAIFIPEWQKNLIIILRNSVIPVSLLLALLFSLVIYEASSKIFIKKIIIFVLLFLTFSDLLRQAKKFTPFTSSEIIFPDTQIIYFLINQQEKERFRVAIKDSNLFPSNFNILYKIELINGYDSIHSGRYEKFSTAANEMRITGLKSPGRNIFLANHNSPVFDLMNVKYVLSLEELESPKLKLVFQEGKTLIYENLNYYPRVFLTNDVEVIKDDDEILEEIIDFTSKGERKIILEENVNFVSDSSDLISEAMISNYFPNKVEITTKSDQSTFLFLADAYDPGWKAYINGVETKVYRANFNFRAVKIPSGEQEIVFNYEPASFKIGKKVSLITFIVLGLLFTLDRKLPLLKKKRL